jgi:hypothetical protein
LAIQVRPDLALFEWSDEDALTATGQEPRQIGFVIDGAWIIAVAVQATPTRVLIEARLKAKNK